jgi:hypothetical protein
MEMPAMLVLCCAKLTVYAFVLLCFTGLGHCFHGHASAVQPCLANAMVISVVLPCHAITDPVQEFLDYVLAYACTSCLIQSL